MKHRYLQTATIASAFNRHCTGARALCLALFFVVMSIALNGQQIPVYSAYFFSKYLVNPAFAGIDNEYRAFGFYRTQWGSLPGRPVTGGATAEASVWNDRIGIGGFVMNDQIGIFNRVNAALTYAQKIKFAQYHQISIGVQGGIFTNRIDFANATTSDLNDPGLAEFKPIKTVFDMSMGISYKWKELLVGFSVHQCYTTAGQLCCGHYLGQL